MTHRSFDSLDWHEIVERLGGASSLESSARETKAFQRPREISSAVELLQIVLAYCLGKGGLRSTAAWAASLGIADISNVALLKRLRQCGDWFAMLVGQALAAGAPEAGEGRLIRLVDATTVAKADRRSKTRNGLWRIHSAFDLPHERFGFFELTDEQGGEQLDRIPVVAGEIRIGDRAYLQPDRAAAVIAAGADILVRAPWKMSWRTAEGRPVDLIAILQGAAPGEVIDRPIWIGRKSGPSLALRLVAVKKPPEAAEAAKNTARRNAQKGGHQIAQATLVAAEWVILVTSLDPDRFPVNDVLDLYRLRWRIELAFKRLKSLIGLDGPPGTRADSARPYVLAHLLLILLLEPVVDEFEDSPHWQNAA